jgi:hypothetical protein
MVNVTNFTLNEPRLGIMLGFFDLALASIRSQAFYLPALFEFLFIGQDRVHGLDQDCFALGLVGVGLLDNAFDDRGEIDVVASKDCGCFTDTESKHNTSLGLKVIVCCAHDFGRGASGLYPGPGKNPDRDTVAELFFPESL